MVVSARRGGRRGARVIAPAATLAVMAVSGLRSMMCPVQASISNVAEFSDDAPFACRDLVRCAARRSEDLQRTQITYAHQEQHGSKHRLKPRLVHVSAQPRTQVGSRHSSREQERQ